MQLKVEQKAIQDIETGKIVQQTSFWAKVKKRQGILPYAFDYRAPASLLYPSEANSRSIHDDLLVLVRYINRDQCFAYVPYGPKDQPEFENYGVVMEELSEQLRDQLPRGCILIRYDLPWENIWAGDEAYFDNTGNWLGPPPVMNQEFRVNFKTRTQNLVKSYSNNLPTNTIFLDLRKSNEKLLENMKAKTRYNIRLSGRKGIRVRNYGPENLDKWYELYRETADRNHITLHSRKYFHHVLSAGYADDPIDARLLMADYNGEYLAALFLVLSEKRGTYLYGASSGKMRNMMATYALQWEAINFSRKAGCMEYDMFGVAPNPDPSHPLYGLYRFKAGFGGRMFHRMGCWDYPLDRENYSTFRAREINSQSYHAN